MKYVALFSEAIPNPYLLGGKGSNLVKLVDLDINIPTGYIILTNSYIRFLNEAKNISQSITSLEKNLQKENLLEYSKKIKKEFHDTEFPPEVIFEIEYVYNGLCLKIDIRPSFAVRSSATIEDSSKFSFAGQAETFLFNNTLNNLVTSIKSCYASLYSPQSLIYILQMKKKGLHLSLYDMQMAVVIQEMIDSEISGVLFTANVINNNRNQMLINSNYGLGETITNNTVNPDTFILNKKKFGIVEKIIGKKEKMSIKNPEGPHTVTIDTDPELRTTCSLEEDKLRQLHELGLKLEETFNCPQDIEWAFENDKLYTLQARPITTLKEEN